MIGDLMQSDHLLLLIPFILGCNATETSREVSETEDVSGVLQTDGQGPLPPGSQALPPISPMGSGVFRRDIPTDMKSYSTDAVCSGCDIVVVTVCSLRKGPCQSLRQGRRIISPRIDAPHRCHCATWICIFQKQ